MDAEIRKIIHLDMDAFYASVEQRDNPAYRGRPIIVGGSPHARGVVATCSYEARTFGIHSAMPSQTAYRLCPNAIFVRPRMDVYRQVSQEIFSIYREYTDIIEPLSLDEAFLDVTGHALESGTKIARQIKQEVFARTGLTVSAGVSYNKFIAKIASDFHKPDGLTVIPPEQAQAFLDDVPIRKFFGVGKVTEQRLLALGVHTGKDLRSLTQEQLIRVFSDRGRLFYDLIRGIDMRPVEPNRIRQSVGKEITLAVDIDDMAEMARILTNLSESVADHLRKRGVGARVVVLKIKFHDFTQITRRITTDVRVETGRDIFQYVQWLLRQVSLRGSVRLLGVSVQRLEQADAQWVQLSLFSDVY